MKLWTPKPYYQLHISLEGQPISTIHVGPEPQELRLDSIALSPGEQQLCLESDRAEAIDVSLQNGDQRVVSVAVADVIMEPATRLDARYLPAHRLDAQIDGQIALLGYDIYRADGGLLAGQQFTIQPYWKVLKRPQRDLSLLIQIFDQAGQQIFQSEHEPVAKDLPTSAWETGELLRGLATVSLPDDLPAGPYTIQIQLFDPVSQAILPLSNNPKQRASSGIQLGIW